MTTEKDPFREAAENDDGSYPDTWKPSVGDLIIGTVSHYDVYEGDYGRVNVCVIDDEQTGKPWSVLVGGAVLPDQFARYAIDGFPGPKPDERVYVKRVEDGVGRTGRKYRRYVLKVEGRNPVSAPLPTPRGDEPFNAAANGNADAHRPFAGSPAGDNPPPYDGEDDLPF